LIDRTAARWLDPGRPVRFAFIALATAALLKREEINTKADPADPFSPWQETSGWRPNADYVRTLYWRSSHQDIEAKLTYLRGGYLLQAAGESVLVSILENRENQFVLLAGSERIAGHVYSPDETFVIVTEGEQATLQWIDPVSRASHTEQTEGDLRAPMPGKIVAVLVGNGQTVTKGAALITIEAMKMEHTIVAVEDGIVDEVLFNQGDQVDEEALLLRFSPTHT
jgi:3-methylcrotonyl-CoA carboxylase alpha subunit